MTGQTQPRPAPDDDAVQADQVGQQRERRTGLRAQVPQQRPMPLSDPDREQYEKRLDAYEVQVSEYRTKLHEVVTQLEAAHHDGLTGTWLRHAGRKLLEQELMRAGRTDTPLSIAFVDVDGLKALNDEEGHAAGDRALIAVARALLSGLRGYDYVIRWGGDEFLCVLPAAMLSEAERRLEQARVSLRVEQGVGISLGIVERHAGEGLEALVARADEALYAGRGRR